MAFKSYAFTLPKFKWEVHGAAIGYRSWRAEVKKGFVWTGVDHELVCTKQSSCSIVLGLLKSVGLSVNGQHALYTRFIGY